MNMMLDGGLHLIDLAAEAKVFNFQQFQHQAFR
jgi:hypothetical protein